MVGKIIAKKLHQYEDGIPLETPSNYKLLSKTKQQ